MARVTADEARRIIGEEQRQLNTVVLPATLNRIRQLMQSETFSICNVGPWPHSLERAALRIFVPAYRQDQDPEKRGYAASTPLPCIYREAKLTGNGGGEVPLEYSWIEDDGRMVALDMIGIGFGLPPQNALLQYGVFVPEGQLPAKNEIAEAQRNLSVYYDRLIEEARDAFDRGPEERKAVITDRHLLAARTKGVDEKWVHHQHTQESVRCDMCGRYNPTGIAKCQCGRILDFALYSRIEKEQAEMMAFAGTQRAHLPVKPTANNP